MTSAAMAVESAGRNAPTVTSARICLVTESQGTAVIDGLGRCRW